MDYAKDYADRMQAQYSQEDLDQMDIAVHTKLGHSNLSAHLAAPRYTRDFGACRKLIEVLEEEMAWFEISKLDTDCLRGDGRYAGQKWEVTLVNIRDLTVRGPTLEIAVAKACLLENVLGGLRIRAFDDTGADLDTIELGGEDGPQEEE